MHQCFKFVFYGVTQYMFRTVFPSIISSSRLYIHQQAYVKQIMLYVQSWTADDVRKDRPKHVECYSIENKFETLVHLVGFTIEIQGGAEPTDTFQIWILRRRDSLSWLAGRGNGRGDDVISYGQSQWSVGTCNNVLPVFVVSATSLGLLGHPTSLYHIFSCEGSWKTVCSGDVSWLFKNSNKPLLTKLRLLLRTYGGACTGTSRHACNNALM